MIDDSISLAGKTALVTGASKRLGRATALALAEAGAHVVVHYNHSAAAAESAVRAIRALGVQAWPVQGELRGRASGEELVKHAVATAGPIHFLVNNASIFPASRLAELDDESLQANLAVNTMAPFGAALAFAEQLDDEGGIVNFLDTRYLDFDEKHVAYHLSKRSLFALTRMLAVELAPRIQVNAVAPGLVLPPPGEDAAYLESLHHTNPLGRHGSAQGIADAVLFLLRSGFVTGQVIFVDGGRHMKGAFYG